MRYLPRRKAPPESAFQLLATRLRSLRMAPAKTAPPPGFSPPCRTIPARRFCPSPSRSLYPQPECPSSGSADHQTMVRQYLDRSRKCRVHYRDYILRADKVVYNQSTSELEAEGHLQVAGGPDDVLIEASRGDMRLNMHTARFYNVTGSLGIGRTGRAVVYSTPNPFLFSGRVLLQTGEGSYRIIDGTMTNCHLPRPDWRVDLPLHLSGQRQGLHGQYLLQVSRRAPLLPALPPPSGGRDRAARAGC